MCQQVELACRAADHGRFDTAVILASAVADDRREYAACRSLLASIYRQGGRHDMAAGYDIAGLRQGPQDDLGRAMCALGAAADRVGVADLAGAREALVAADRAVDQVPADHWAGRWFEPWLTQAWVAAEVSLLADDPAGAVRILLPFARIRPRTVPPPRWPFERAKTWLFLGVAQRCAGLDAADSLLAAVRIAAQAQLAPLLVPAWQQLRLVDPAAAAPFGVRAAGAADLLAQHRPPQ